MSLTELFHYMIQLEKLKTLFLSLLCSSGRIVQNPEVIKIRYWKLKITKHSIICIIQQNNPSSSSSPTLSLIIKWAKLRHNNVLINKLMNMGAQIISPFVVRIHRFLKDKQFSYNFIIYRMQMLTDALRTLI